MFRSWKEFIIWESTTMDTLDVKKSYIDIAGDFMAGVLLSQIVYWYLPNKEGKSKLRVKKDGHYWIAKKREEWYEEIRFSEQNYKTAIKKLEKANVVVKERFKFAGTPTTHIRLNVPIFLAKLNDLFKQQQAQLQEGEFDDFNVYLINEIVSNPLSDMDSVKSTESKRLNPPNGNGEIHRMKTANSTESITKSTTKNNSKINIKDQSIMESEILNIDLPESIKQQLKKYIDRLMDDNINVQDVQLIYKTFEDRLNEYRFATKLADVLQHTKKKITNIRSVLTKSLNKELNDPVDKYVLRHEQNEPVEGNKTLTDAEIIAIIDKQTALFNNQSSDE